MWLKKFRIFWPNRRIPQKAFGAFRANGTEEVGEDENRLQSAVIYRIIKSDGRRIRVLVRARRDGNLSRGADCAS